MIDFFKDVLDVLKVKSLMVTENITVITKPILKGIHKLMILFTFIGMFLCLSFFIIDGFYFKKDLYWCFLYIFSLPILAWVNQRL